MGADGPCPPGGGGGILPTRWVAGGAGTAGTASVLGALGMKPLDARGALDWRGCPSAAKASEIDPVSLGSGAEEPEGSGAAAGEGAVESITAVMLARSSGPGSGTERDCAEPAGSGARGVSFSKTCVASLSSSHSMSMPGRSLAPTRVRGVTSAGETIRWVVLESNAEASTLAVSGAGGAAGTTGTDGNDPRPGGGGGGGRLASWLSSTARRVPEAVRFGGGCTGGRLDAVVCVIAPASGVATNAGASGGSDAGLGIPRSVRRASGAGSAACRREADPGGAGGAEGVERSLVFFPRPSKISRSDPPLLFVSLDIRVS
jgi:hypothetical protein